MNNLYKEQNKITEMRDSLDSKNDNNFDNVKIFKEGHKNLKKIHLFLTLCNKQCQIQVEFCGLLTIYEFHVTAQKNKTKKG